jgi:hypothetical protein
MNFSFKELRKLIKTIGSVVTMSGFLMERMKKMFAPLDYQLDIHILALIVKRSMIKRAMKSHFSKLGILGVKLNGQVIGVMNLIAGLQRLSKQSGVLTKPMTVCSGFLYLTTDITSMI